MLQTRHPAVTHREQPALQEESLPQPVLQPLLDYPAQEEDVTYTFSATPPEL